LLQLWESSDSGNGWLVLADFYTDTPAAVLAVPHNPVERSLLVGVRNRLIKLYQSVGRQEWAVTQHFLADNLRITSIVTTDNYQADGAIYVSSNQGVLQSQDGGATWAPVGAGLADRTIVAFQPASNGRPASAVELGGVIWQG
jgi:photosystem II stability/assembly factor-like uncharacterized protein